MTEAPKKLSDLEILIVDDESDICTMVKFALHHLGVSNIHMAEDGQSAWDKFRETRGTLDLIVSDWMMPNMSGLEFLRRVRELDPKIPFVMLTIMNDSSHVAEAVQCGVTGSIGTPFTLTDFQRHIRKIASSIKAS